MTFAVSRLVRRLGAVALFSAVLLAPTSAGAYSVLSHEEVVDMAWKTNIVPMLKARFPGISDDDIRQAHAYAYGGSVIQDIGYYPFGSHYFSDLLHYVRPEVFVETLIRDSTTPNEYAFALGALAHYCGDIIGHPAINQATADENPPLQTRFGRIVTYAEDPTAHIRTEFGFDVVEVAQGHYSQQNYRDFIGFQVSKTLLERAFLETYGIPMSELVKHEDLAIGSYRRAVSSLIPNMTKVAFVTYKDKIEQAAPGTAKNKFLYRLNQTEYTREFGTEYNHLGFWGRTFAFLIRIIPKVGPFKALKVTIPNAQEQDVYLKSMNDSVDRYKLYLTQIHAAPAPLPPPDPKDAADARKAADKLTKDAGKANKLAQKAADPEDKAQKEKVALNVEKVALKADAAATRSEARVEKAQAAEDAGFDLPREKGALATDAPIKPPITPKLPELDLDTGRPSAAGEYLLADKTYSHLLDDLVQSHKASPASGNTASGPATPPVPAIDPGLASAIQRFFAQRVTPTGPTRSAQEAAREAALLQREETGLAALKTVMAEQPK